MPSVLSSSYTGVTSDHNARIVNEQKQPQEKAELTGFVASSVPRLSSPTATSYHSQFVIDPDDIEAL